MSKRRHDKTRAVLIFATIYACIFSAAVVITVWRVIGWLVATAVIGTCAYVAGRWPHVMRARRRQRKLAVNLAYGSGRAYRGGSYPPAAVTVMDAVSAYPADLIGSQVIDALTNLGWPKASIDRASITGAITDVCATGATPDVSNVLAVILRRAGETRARRVNPNEYREP